MWSESGCQQLAAAPGAAVERDCVVPLHEAAAIAVKTANDPPKPLKWGRELQDVRGPPPEGVALIGKGPRRVEPGADKEQRPFQSHRGMPQYRKQRGVPRPRIHRVAHAARPACHRARTVAARGKSLPHLRAIARDRRLDAVPRHPAQDLARVMGKLQLQELLPHLFLRPAQEDHIAGKAARPRHDAAAEIDQLVDRRDDGAAMAQVIAEIDETIAIHEPRRDLVMQAGEALGLAMDRSDSPDPARTTQAGELAFRGAAVHPTLHAAICRWRTLKGRSGRREQLLDSANGRGFVDPLDRRELANQPIERGLIDLPLAIGLLRLSDVPEQVTNDLSNRGRVA